MRSEKKNVKNKNVVLNFWHEETNKKKPMDTTSEARRLYRVLEELTFCLKQLEGYPEYQNQILEAFDKIHETANLLLDK